MSLQETLLMFIGFYGIVEVFSRDTFSINLVLLNMYHNFENHERCLFKKHLSRGKNFRTSINIFPTIFFNNYFLKLLQKLKKPLRFSSLACICKNIEALN